MRISVIVPSLGDAVSPPEGFDEVIVVQAGKPIDAGRAKVIPSPRGRAIQMNAGAEAAQGDVLLFLHADTRLHPASAAAIRAAITSGAIGGCFETVFDPPHPILRAGDIWRNIRARILREFYGDQSIFIRRDVFAELGGYRPLLQMEDFDLCRRMRRSGRVAFIARQSVTSGRGYLGGGIARTWLRHQLTKIRYFLCDR